MLIHAHTLQGLLENMNIKLVELCLSILSQGYVRMNWTRCHTLLFITL